MILFSRVSKSYTDNKVLDNFNYCFADTGLYAVKGASGCGKTTLLNLIGGLLKPTEGKILYSEDIRYIRNSSIYIFQENNLLDKLTVYKNVKLFTEIIRKKLEDAEIDEVLGRLDILKYKDRKVMNLSGGERQRVSIAIAMLRKAKVIIADEPCSSLDEENSRKVMEIFQKLSKEVLVIFSSHNALMIEEYCDKVLDLEKDDFTAEVNPAKEGVEPSKSQSLLPVKKIWALQRSTVSTKKISLVFSFLIFSILIFIIAFSISIHLYSKPVVIAKDIINRNADGFSIQRANGTFPDLSEYKGNTYDQANHSIVITQFEGYQAKPASDYFSGYNPISTVTKDESLSLDELRITDYTAYYLRYYDVISFSELSECVNQELIISCISYRYSVKIIEIIETSFSELYESGKEIRLEYKDKLINYCYANAWMNRETLYYLEGNIRSLDNGVVNGPYLKTIDEYKLDEEVSIDCWWNPDTELTGNFISISKGFLSFLNKTTNRDYQVGDTVSLTLTDSPYKSWEREYTFVIKDIFFVYDDDMYVMNEEYWRVIRVSKETIEVLLKESSMAYTSRSFIYITDYGDEKELIQMMQFLDSAGYQVYYDGFVGVESIFNKLEMFQKIMVFVLVFFICLAGFIIIYNVYNQYSANRTAFSILEIYGMGRANGFIMLSSNNLLLLLPSFALGGVVAYYSNKAMDALLKVSGDTDRVVSTYHFSYTVYAVLMVLGFTLVFVFLGYLLSLRRKLRSHIGNH